MKIALVQNGEKKTKTNKINYVLRLNSNGKWM